MIHAHGHSFITSFQAALTARLLKKHFVLTMHDVGFAYQNHMFIRGLRPIINSTRPLIFKHSDREIAQNTATYNLASRFEPRKIVTIPPEVNFDKFRCLKSEGGYVTYLAARLVPQKGGETFVATPTPKGCGLLWFFSQEIIALISFSLKDSA